MPEFTIKALDAQTNAPREFVYNSDTSSLTEGGVDVIPVQAQPYKRVRPFGKDMPVGKTSDVKTLKVSLGLNCNYECTYCSQRFVPRADASNPSDIEPFVQSLIQNLTSDPDRIEFWGGEPFVYWKTLKPLAERLKGLYPAAGLSIITNGSMLTPEINDWIESMGISIGLSHDGPGYHARGVDPLDDPAKRDQIMDLYRRLKPRGKMSVNAMMHSKNTSRKAVQEWLAERFGEDVSIGEGGFVDPYDEGGMASVFQAPSEHIEYRRQGLNELRDGGAVKFQIVHEKLDDFIRSIQTARPSSAVGQKCGMDKRENLAVDMFGNVLTCQNVSIKGVAPNGESHHIGHISDLSSVQMKTSTHWSLRDECPKCPVVQLCKGSCQYLDGDLWEAGCDSAFSDNIPFLALAIEMMTGAIPYYIDGPQREDRKDIFGAVHGVPEDKPAKKIIPIQQVTA